MKITLTLFALLGLAVAAIAAPEVGKPAPDFTLKDAAGKEVKLSDYKGKYVVLEWVNFGCPFVKKQYGTQNIQKLQKDAVDKGVVWLSICSSAPGQQGYLADDKVAAAVKESGSNATAYLVDPAGTVGRLYGARTTPEMYIVNPKGDVVYAGAIDDQPTPDPATVKEAKNYVTAALDEVLAGKPVTTATTTSYGCSVKYAK